MIEYEAMILEKYGKYITFFVPIKKECSSGKTITGKMRFNDSFIFMPTSLSDLLITCVEFSIA